MRQEVLINQVTPLQVTTKKKHLSKRSNQQNIIEPWHHL